MDRWARIVDHLLGEVIGDGDISNLPGAGKPLPLPQDSHTPPDKRAAFKIMQDNNVTPEWMALGKSVEQSESEIRAEIESRVRNLDAASGGVERRNARQRSRNWSRYVDRLDERIERHNRAVTLHNLKAPSGIPHRPMLNSGKLITQIIAKAERKS